MYKSIFYNIFSMHKTNKVHPKWYQNWPPTQAFLGESCFLMGRVEEKRLNGKLSQNRISPTGSVSEHLHPSPCDLASQVSYVFACRSVIIDTSLHKGTGIVNVKYVIFFIFCRCILEHQLKIKMSCLHCCKFLLWYVHLLRQPPFVLPCKRIRIPREFCLWNAESGKFLLVGSEILGFGIQNPEFHEWLGSGILVPPTKNLQFSTCISRIHSVESRSQDCLGFQWRIQERGPGAQSPPNF